MGMYGFDISILICLHKTKQWFRYKQWVKHVSHTNTEITKSNKSWRLISWFSATYVQPVRKKKSAKEQEKNISKTFLKLKSFCFKAFTWLWLLTIYNTTVKSDVYLHSLPEFSTLCRPLYTLSKQMANSFENLHKVLPQGTKEKVKKRD